MQHLFTNSDTKIIKSC